MVAETDRPSPVPPALRLVVKNGSMTCDKQFSGIPTPSSRTSIRTVCSSWSYEVETKIPLPFSGSAWQAFWSKLITTCSSCRKFPSIKGIFKPYSTLKLWVAFLIILPRRTRADFTTELTSICSSAVGIPGCAKRFKSPTIFLIRFDPSAMPARSWSILSRIVEKGRPPM